MSDPEWTYFALGVAGYWREQLFRWRDMGTTSRMEVMKAMYRTPQ